MSGIWWGWDVTSYSLQHLKWESVLLFCLPQTLSDKATLELPGLVLSSLAASSLI